MNISPTHAEWLSSLGEYGTRFTLARMLKRIDRVKVDNTIAELLKRVAEITKGMEDALQ